MAEYSRLARGSFVSTGGAHAVILPFLPDRVELINVSAAPAANAVSSAIWDIAMGQGTAAEQVYTSFGTTPTVLALTTDFVASGGVSTFTRGIALQFGQQLQIASISKAAAAVVTTASPHGLSTGDIVTLQGLFQSPTTGMSQLAGIPFAITVTGATTFTIPYNTNQSNFTALSGSPSGAFVTEVLYPALYAPGVSFISAMLLSGAATASTVFPSSPANVPVGQTYVATSAPHNFVVGQEVAFRISPPWGTVQLNSLPNVLIPGSPIYGYVVLVLSPTQVVVNIDSSSFTAFNSNPVYAAGLTPAQILAVGDVNTGGLPISPGSDLYPSPVVNGVSTINGPAINGAFVNATCMGFIVGAGAGVINTSSVLVGASGNRIIWWATADDYSV